MILAHNHILKKKQLVDLVGLPLNSGDQEKRTGYNSKSTYLDVVTNGAIQNGCFIHGKSIYKWMITGGTPYLSYFRKPPFVSVNSAQILKMLRTNAPIRVSTVWIKTCCMGSHFFEVFNMFFIWNPPFPQKNALSFNSTNVLQKLWLSTKQFHVLSWIAECLD